jgi:predicted nucleic acid-binding protein
MNRSGVLIDAGPLVALLDQTDSQHERAKAIAAACAPPLRTCEAVLAEAAHLLSKAQRSAPAGLLALGRTGAIELALHVEDHWEVLGRLVERYRDVPASLADVCLIRCAEVHAEPRIATFDSDFGIYRWSRNRRFEIIS